MSEKSPERLLTLILETVDLLLNCSAHKILKKENHILTTFPFLSKFNMIDYCSINRRLAVGTTKGQFALFDIRSLRCTLLHSFNGPITCLKFSVDGRQLVAYCYDEMKICIWNTHFSLFGLLSSTPKAGVCFHLKQQKKVNNNQINKIHLIWKNANSFKLVFDENYELSFTV
uniref:WD repeat-containing protein 7 (Trinotate prediction) n=1 Tax=Myxobolus squamalis TaxID=59785 RepID=A0A6B2G6F4_MYXSQ